MNTETDVLQLALDNDELDRFIVGEPFYFFEAHAENDEPQNIAAAFDRLLLVRWTEQGDPALWQRWAAGMLKAVHSYPDSNRAIYCVADWLWYYYYCLNKGRSQPQGPYGSLPRLDLSEVAHALQTRLGQCQSQLEADTRWAGAAWNSQQGLWQPVLRLLQGIIKLEGPNCLPTAG